MYVISILVLIIISALTLKSEGTPLAAFIDAPSFVFVVLICLPFLASTGLLRDFNNAFKFAVKTNIPVAKKELKRSITAVSFVIKVLWAAGIFWTVFSVINGFGGGRGIGIAQEKVAAYLAIMALPMLYASFFVLLLLPMKVRLELRLQEPKTKKPKKPKKQFKSEDSRRQQ